MKKEVSCRVASTIIKFFQSEKKSSNLLLSDVGISEDFLVDPSNWITREIVNKLFDRMEKLYFDSNIAVKIGISGSSLGGWGACDIIFRLIGEPEKIYLQAKRFGSYFYENIELRVVDKGEYSLVFECFGDNYSHHDLKFLQGALAGIQWYWNLDSAETFSIDKNKFKLSWQPKSNFFGQRDLKTALSPKLIQEAVELFDNIRHQLEKKNIEIELKNRMLKEFYYKIKELEKNGEASEYKLCQK